MLQPEVGPFTAVAGIDEPRRFAAYLHALKGNAVTATDARLFQAPFQLMDYQLTPLMKALSLPAPRCAAPRGSSATVYRGCASGSQAVIVAARNSSRDSVSDNRDFRDTRSRPDDFERGYGALERLDPR